MNNWKLPVEEIGTEMVVQLQDGFEKRGRYQGAAEGVVKIRDAHGMWFFPLKNIRLLRHAATQMPESLANKDEYDSDPEILKTLK